MSQQINLLRRTSGKGSFALTSARTMALGLGICVTLSLLMGGYENYRLRATEAEAAKVAAALKQAMLVNDKATAVRVPRKPNAQLEVRVQELEAQLKARQEIVDALSRGLVGTTDGFSEYMRVFSRQSQQGVWLIGFDIGAGGDELTIMGRALGAELVPAYLQRLNREAAIQGRQFGSMVISQATPAAQIGPGEQQPVDAKGSGPRAVSVPYLEFTLSSNDPGRDHARGPLAGVSTPPARALSPVDAGIAGISHAK
jgi:hypothetical protein